VTTRFDVLVVGGGSAGCVMAGRLSEDPRRSVCLIEAGPDYGPYEDGRWPEDMLDARRLAFTHAWETEVEDPWQLRARIMGGCSAHNACIVLPGTPSDYDEWGHGWSYAAIEPYLRRVEEALQVRRLTGEELTPWHRAFAEAAGDDAILHPVNALGTVRWNAAFAYLDPARGRENLTILPDTLVGRVLLDGDRAVGVATPDGEVRAQVVVLSAGAYGTPGILLRSGIGPERGLPVGEGLSDHVGTGLGFEATEAFHLDNARFEGSRPIYMAQVSIALRSTHCTDGLYDLFLFPAVDPTADGRYRPSAGVFAMKPESRGSVRLTSPDPRAPLAVDHGFLSAPRDGEVVAEGIEALRRLAATDAVRYGLEVRPGPDVDALEHVQRTARGFYHPVGTCAIGAVVDGRAAVHGIEGLFVVDASIMPTIPRANTNLTTIALAERLAEGMLESG
jgi:choline dehydrogenase-like flavoprotein